MSEVTVITEDELDALKELTNIGMGRAAALLAEILEQRIILKVPDVRVVQPAGLPQYVLERDSLGITRHGFRSDGMSGEALMVFIRDSYKNLQAVYGYPAAMPLPLAQQQELLLEIASNLCAACLSGIGEQFDVEFIFSPPRLLCLEKWTSVYEEVFADRVLAWQHSLLIDVHFQLERDEFTARLCLFIPDATLPKVKERIAVILEDL